MKNPKHILITGASSGIGEALALHYAAPDIRLSLSGRNKDRLEDVAQACHAKGASVHTHIIDVTDCKGMADWINGLYADQPIDLVIANAGISGGTGGHINGEEFSAAREIFEVNLTGVINTIEPAIKQMQAKPSDGVKGQVAIISSLAGFRGWTGSPAYSASKGAVRFYGEALRGSLRQSGIRVNVVCPGFVASRMTEINKYNMPLKMSAERAAKIIAKGLAKNKGRICFPWPTHFFAWLIGILPDPVAQFLMDFLPAKSKR
jgi:short-subunit dehydrogenase